MLILKNTKLILKINEYGGSFQSIRYISDQDERELILTANSDYYKNNKLFLGAFIGRVAGRISIPTLHDKLTLNLKPNEGRNFLHGGENGLHTKKFKYKLISNEEVRLFVKIFQSEDGIPGDIDLQIDVKLLDESIIIRYSAVSTKRTIITLTNHTYWNLNKDKSEEILNHKLTILDSSYLTLNNEKIPNGKQIIADIENIRISKIIDQNTNFYQGIDHFFEIKNKNVILQNDEYMISFTTTDPGFVIYTGGNISGNLFKKFGGICLEDQNFQDSINCGFGNWVLEPGIKYEKETVWKITKN